MTHGVIHQVMCTTAKQATDAGLMVEQRQLG
jgi:hypothetical protein